MRRQVRRFAEIHDAEFRDRGDIFEIIWPSFEEHVLVFEDEIQIEGPLMAETRTQEFEDLWIEDEEMKILVPMIESVTRYIPPRERMTMVFS